MADDPVAGQSGSQAAVLEVAPDAGAGDAGRSAVTAEPTWFDSLPDGLKAEPSLQAFKGKPLTAVVESHVSAQKMIGDSIRVPGEKATPEERAKFTNAAYDKLGRPASPDKYVYKAPSVEGVEWNDAQAKAFLPTAHALGLNSHQVEEIFKYQADLAKTQGVDHAGDFSKCMKSLVEGDEKNAGWGSTADRYINTAKRTLETMFHPDVAKHIVASGVGNNPEFVRGMARIGKELIEDGLIVGEESGGITDGKGLLNELEKMMGDPKSAYFDKAHPKHEEAVQRAVDIRRYLGAKE